MSRELYRVIIERVVYLIDELKQYTSEEEIMRFISSTDFLVKHMNDKRLKIFEKNMISNSLKNVNRFIITCYSKKLQQQFDDGIISSKDELLHKLADFISSLSYTIKVGNREFEMMTNDDIKEIVQAAFKKKNINVSLEQEEYAEVKK